MKFFEKLKKLNNNEKIEKILPSDVRYALQYKEGMLNKEEIETLIMSNFESEGFYLIAKSVQKNPEIQKKLLESYSKFVLNDEPNSNILLKEFLSKEISNIVETEVNGVKLAQVSRQGFELWQEKYKNVAEKLGQSSKDVFILAHSTFIGLSHFIKEFSKKGKNINIIIPNWLSDNKEHIGYCLEFSSGNVKVSWLDKYFEKTNVVLFDDTIKTGNTINKIQDLWSKTLGGLPEVISLDKVV